MAIKAETIFQIGIDTPKAWLTRTAEDPFEKFVRLFYSGGVSHFYENSRLAKTNCKPILRVSSSI